MATEVSVKTDVSMMKVHVHCEKAGLSVDELKTSVIEAEVCSNGS